MAKQNISVKISSYREAERIDFGYEETERYLKSLISNHVPNPSSILEYADFAELKRYGKVIRGVAQAMLIIRYHIPEKTRRVIFKKIMDLQKARKSNEREMLEERISIQLEGCNVPDNHYLVKKYNRIKRN